MVPSFKISRFRTQHIFQLKEPFRVSIWFRRRFTVWLSPDEVMLISALRPETDEAHILSLESAIAPEVAQAADVVPVLPTAAAVGVLSLPSNIPQKNHAAQTPQLGSPVLYCCMLCKPAPCDLNNFPHPSHCSGDWYDQIIYQ